MAHVVRELVESAVRVVTSGMPMSMLIQRMTTTTTPADPFCDVCANDVSLHCANCANVPPWFGAIMDRLGIEPLSAFAEAVFYTCKHDGERSHEHIEPFVRVIRQHHEICDAFVACWLLNNRWGLLRHDEHFSSGKGLAIMLLERTCLWGVKIGLDANNQYLVALQ